MSDHQRIWARQHRRAARAGARSLSRGRRRVANRPPRWLPLAIAGAIIGAGYLLIALASFLAERH